MLPIETPAVILTLSVPPIPAPNRHSADVSDCHAVDSLPDDPTPPLGLLSTRPSPPPITVTSVPPDATTFLTGMSDTRTLPS
eukprot:1534862-Rhodomonas_salina.1